MEKGSQGDDQSSAPQPQQGLQEDQPSPPQPQRSCGAAWCNRYCVAKLALCLVVILAVLGIILWQVLRDDGIRIWVTSTTLTAFNLTSSNTLKYNITSVIALRNPNKFGGYYVVSLQADAYYAGEYWMQWAQLPTQFYLTRKHTTFLTAAMVGEGAVDLGTSGLELYAKQRKAGAYDVEVRVTGRVRYTTASTTRTSRLNRKCWIPGVRLNQPGDLFQSSC